MWPAIAEEDLKCTECYHTIPAGTDCLSQMPVPMPDGFRRRKYDNFCADCPECKAQRRRRPCYVRHLSHWYARKEKTTGSATCVYCGDAIPDGTRAVVQKFFAWPEDDGGSEKDVDSSQDNSVGTGVRAAGTSLAGAVRRANSGTWQNLSPQTQSIFKTRGLGRGLGSRSPVMARRFYETSVPEAIRNQGERAVLRFLQGKHASHIRPVSRMPTWAKRPSNVIWENAKRNLSRGNRSMTPRELAAAKSASRGSVIGATARGVAKGGLIAAATEAPVAAMENLLHWKRGRKTRQRAAKDTAVSTAGAAAVGAGATAAAAVAAKGATMVGIAPTLGPAGAPLAVAGVGLMVGTAAYRLYKAAKRDLPLDEYHVYFCKSTNCRKKYARQVTKATQGRSSFGGPWAIALGLAGLAIVAITAVAWLS